MFESVFSGKDLKEVLRLLFPMVLTMTLELSISVVDTLMLGHYSEYHLAAVGLASSLWTPVGCFLIGVTFGLTPLVTRHLHGRQRKLVNLYMSQAVGVCLFLGVVGALLTAFVLPFFAEMMAGEQETRDVTVGYLRFFAPALPVLALMTAYKNLYEAAGRPLFPLMMAGIGLVLNASMNYVLIFGHFGFPAMGAEGAALASTLSLYLAVTGFVLYDRFISHTPLFSRLVWRYIKQFGVLLSVGAPAGLSFAFEIGLFSSLTWLISAFGDLALGAGQIVMSYSSFLFTPLMAMSAVTAIVVAKALSQEGASGVRRKMNVVLTLGGGYVTFCFLMTQLFHSSIPKLYNSNPEVIQMAAGVLVISACYQIADMLQTVMTGALRGFRDTRVPMIAFGVSLFALSMPLGYWLSHYSPWSSELGIRGFYLGLLAGLSLLAALLIWRYNAVLKRAERRRPSTQAMTEV